MEWIGRKMEWTEQIVPVKCDQCGAMVTFVARMRVGSTTWNICAKCLRRLEYDESKVRKES